MYSTTSIIQLYLTATTKDVFQIIMHDIYAIPAEKRSTSNTLCYYI